MTTSAGHLGTGPTAGAAWTHFPRLPRARPRCRCEGADDAWGPYHTARATELATRHVLRIEKGPLPWVVGRVQVDGVIDCAGWRFEKPLDWMVRNRMQGKEYTVFTAAVVFACGCQEALGLQGLTFEAPAATGGAASGGAAATPSGGASQFAPPSGGSTSLGGLPEGFPSTKWPADSVIVSLPLAGSDPRILRYSPSNFELTTYQTEASTARELSRQSWRSDTPHAFTHLAAWWDDGALAVVGYDAADGWKEDIAAVGQVGPLRIESSSANAGYSHFVAATWRGEAFLFAYDETSGEYVWVPTARSAQTSQLEHPVGQGNLGPGWREIHACSFADQDGLLLFREGTIAAYAFPDPAKIGQGGSPPTTLSSAQLRELYYDAEFELERPEIVDSRFSPTSILPLDVFGTKAVLFYDENTGWVDVRALPVDLSREPAVWFEQFVSSPPDESLPLYAKWRRALTGFGLARSGEELLAVTFDGVVADARIFSGDVPIQVR